MKKTKIVATISDKTCTPDFIRELFNEGMNVVRMNTAHQTPADSLKVIDDVRQVSDKIALLLDTKGPEVRTVKSDLPVELKKGEQIQIKGDPAGETSAKCVFVNYVYFVRDVPIGKCILIERMNWDWKNFYYVII